ncbi:hypothetical protein SPRG_07259 [Saprolegnia parasitica CBS 223.65]|uniref:C3H1-type domain-containing protein n=1 Tax=Saprolegnia parasitica (strain CBS 223.65) TaxID=695850 RepID=A0A067CMC5_SAPPC|nr:hypothetical protein SPRG_07259 [Saprolegnia parasitica CBS 223.65]KDO27982.1 hypothetical protein SPRG_07259 [Saprolegnia parasitica CBS 223.65]|eukprot:XP_012201431.1 hypothetical protein SPRG_07259 [Saprolegnia parasitica CBS 223.65]
MTTEEAIVRARIAALKNVIAAREGGASTMRAESQHAAERVPAASSRNLTWKAPDASPPAPAVHAVAPLPYCIPLAATACPTITTPCRSPSQNFNTSNSAVSAAVRPRSGLFVSPYAPPRSSRWAHRFLRSRSPSSATTTRTEYCRYYNRFGVCNKQNACPFIHDSRKVAVCRPFLRGACDDKACRLSHVRDQNKMPVCTRFLKGMCSREDCPFRHVNVSHDAAICDAFLRGYCPDGADCRMKHELPKGRSGGEALVGHVAPASPVDAAPTTEPALSIRPTIRFQPRVAP